MVHSSTSSTGRKDHRFGHKQPVQFIVFHWDHLRKPVEGRRYGDSQQNLRIIWCAAVEGETTKIVIGHRTIVIIIDTKQAKAERLFPIRGPEQGADC